MVQHLPVHDEILTARAGRDGPVVALNRRAHHLLAEHVTGQQQRVLAAVCHSAPLDMTICKPLRVAAITLGVIRATLALQVSGGKRTLPVTCACSRSTMLMLSPPVLAT